MKEKGNKGNKGRIKETEKRQEEIKGEGKVKEGGNLGKIRYRVKRM